MCESRRKHPWTVCQTSNEPLIVAVIISNTVPNENSTQPKEFKQQDNEERLNNWRGKKNI